LFEIHAAGMEESEIEDRIVLLNEKYQWSSLSSNVWSDITQLPLDKTLLPLLKQQPASYASPKMDINPTSPLYDATADSENDADLENEEHEEEEEEDEDDILCVTGRSNRRMQAIADRCSSQSGVSLSPLPMIIPSSPTPPLHAASPLPTADQNEGEGEGEGEGLPACTPALVTPSNHRHIPPSFTLFPEQDDSSNSDGDIPPPEGESASTAVSVSVKRRLRILESSSSEDEVSTAGAGEVTAEGNAETEDTPAVASTLLRRRLLVDSSSEEEEEDNNRHAKDGVYRRVSTPGGSQSESDEDGSCASSGISASSSSSSSSLSDSQSEGENTNASPSFRDLLNQPSTKSKAKAKAITKTTASTKTKTKSFVHTRKGLAEALYTSLNERAFDGKLPVDCPIRWSKRLRSTAGTTIYKRQSDKNNGGAITTTISIDLSTKVVDDYSKLQKTLAHEMCHVAVFAFHGPKEAPHGAVFKSYAMRVQKKCPEIQISLKHDYVIAYRYRYNCLSCGSSVGRHSKSINIERKVCGRCGGQLHMIDNSETANSNRKENPLAKYVKENYADTKMMHPQSTPQQLMKILSQQYSARKMESLCDNIANLTVSPR
jgi:predicted SprT family Zn-dependent metalloprotease